MTALDALLTSLPRTSLIVGKGGVGKTTCAVGIAAAFAERGQRTLLLSTDPAAALSEVIGAPVATHAAPVESWPNLEARQLSAPELRAEFLREWREVIAEIVDRGTYLDRDDVDGLVDAALPGVDEIFALLTLADILARPSETYTRIVVDTAPTGHTLRLLALPETFRALLAMLEMMQKKHRFMVRALTRRYRRDRADDFLEQMRTRIDALRTSLSDAQTVAAVVVTRPEAVVASETARYLDALTALHIRIAALVTNVADTPVARWPGGPVARYFLPREVPPRGIKEVVSLLATLSTVPPRHRTTGPPDHRTTAPPHHRTTAPPGHRTTGPPVKTLTIVGGKGGVGKSTVSCALALAATEEHGGTTLLVSTDPAPSLADALGQSDAAWARDDIEVELDEAPGLVVRQMDATAAFTRLRDTYRARIDALFSGLMSRGVDVEQDRAVLRELLALAPPGIDEVFALSILGDTLAEGRFTRIVVDPAPTGHLLRLLEMPAVAIEWTHRLMRLMLKYREVVALGDSAQDLLDFAKRTRALDELLHDAERSGLVIVALDEPIVRAETATLAAAVRACGVDVSALVWNRVTTEPVPLPAAVSARQFCAMELQPPPVGVPALREWFRSWRVVSPHS